MKIGIGSNGGARCGCRRNGGGINSRELVGYRRRGLSEALALGDAHRKTRCNQAIGTL
jgi:hypothetical protein